MFVAQRAISLVLVILIITACTNNSEPETVDHLAPDNSTSETRQSTQEAEVAQTPQPTNTSKRPSNNGRAQQASAKLRSRDTSPYLPTEDLFLQGIAVSSEAVSTALKSKKFDELALAFEKDMGTNRNARDLTVLYREAINEQLSNNARLSTFVCGTSLCMGSILTNGSNDSYFAWKERFSNSKATPHYVFTDTTFDRGKGNFENRFFFSSDPSSNAIRVPRGG